MFGKLNGLPTPLDRLSFPNRPLSDAPSAWLLTKDNLTDDIEL